MSSARPSISDLPFAPSGKPSVGFEIFRLAQLYRRAERGSLDHSLLAPQRPGFHTVYVGLRGRGRHMVDFSPCPMGAGQVTVVARGRIQQFVPARDLDVWMLLFSTDFIATGSSADPLAVSELLSPTWRHPSLAVEAVAHQGLLALCHELNAEYARPLDRVQVPLIAALLRALLLQLERAVARAGPPAPPPALQRFFTTVERDFALTRNVSHYAHAAGVSPRRLAELLQQRGGLNAKRVISERVILEQKRLLAHSDLSVKELADRTGFAEPTNLVKFFRLHTGTTPQAFRIGVRAFLPSGRRS